MENYKATNKTIAQEVLVDGAIEEKETEKMNPWYIGGLIACVVVIPFAIVFFLHCYLRKRKKMQAIEDK